MTFETGPRLKIFIRHCFQFFLVDDCKLIPIPISLNIHCVSVSSHFCYAIIGDKMITIKSAFYLCRCPTRQTHELRKTLLSNKRLRILFMQKNIYILPNKKPLSFYNEIISKLFQVDAAFNTRMKGRSIIDIATGTPIRYDSCWLGTHIDYNFTLHLTQ